jgi:hypothetical protein
VRRRTLIGPPFDASRVIARARQFARAISLGLFPEDADDNARRDRANFSRQRSFRRRAMIGALARARRCD